MPKFVAKLVDGHSFDFEDAESLHNITVTLDRMGYYETTLVDRHGRRYEVSLFKAGVSYIRETDLSDSGE